MSTTSTNHLNPKTSVNQILWVLLILLTFTSLPSLHAQESYFSANIGPCWGKTSYNLIADNVEGTHPINYWGMNLIGKTDNFYCRVNINGLFTSFMGKSPEEGMKISDDAVHAKGTDVSFIDFAYGIKVRGYPGLALHFDYGLHGPLVPTAGEYPDVKTSKYYALGLEGCLLSPIGNFARVMTIVNADPLFIPSAGGGTIDGFAVGVETQLQLSVLRYYGIGFTPRYEYRRYSMPIDHVVGPMSTSTWSVQVHFFVGV